MSKKEKIEEKSSKLQETLDKLDKQYGKNSVVLLDDKNTENYEIISTGSIGFDYITLGVGGFIKGKLYDLRGWEGVGKSSICGHAVANCQKNGGKVLYLDGECAVDKEYMTQLGVDTSKLLFTQPSNGEDGFNILLQLIESGEIDLAIVDSDSSLLPKSVIDGEVGDSAIGKKARLNSNAYPKIKTALSRNNVCVIVVSQYREKIGQMFGDPKTVQGGHALKFYSDCIIEVSKSLAKEGDVTYGNLTKVKAIKNRTFAPYRQSSFEIQYGKGIDKTKELLELASDNEVIKKWGKTVTFEENKYEIEEFNRKLENSKFFNDLKAKVVEKIKNSETKLEENVTNEV